VQNILGLGVPIWKGKYPKSGQRLRGKTPCLR
jgi:hypothetical protein